MARSLYFTLCMLVLLQAFLPGSAEVVYPSLSSVFSDASTSSLSTVRNVYSDTATRTFSCSSTSVTAYRFNSVAFAFSSSTAKTSAVVAGAVKAASDAMADAIADSNGQCRSAEDTSIVNAVAQACASAMIQGRTESFSVAYAAGASSAGATGCAFSSAYANSLVVGLADAVAKAVSGDGSNGKCAVFSSAEGQAYVASVAKLAISGMAKSWSSAYAYGGRQPGKAAAASIAAYSNDVSVYATAVARLFSYACARCTSGLGYCKFCNSWKIPAGDWASTETFGVAAKGRLALASAISDASSRICSNTITVDTAVKGVVVAASNVFVQLAAAAFGWAQAANNAVACTTAVSSTSAIALSETYAQVISGAWADATKKDLCSTNAMGGIFADATARVQVDKIVRAYIDGCAFGNLPGYTTYVDIATKCYDHVYDVYANGFASAFAEVTTMCNCAGNCWCCNDFPDKRQCFY